MQLLNLLLVTHNLLTAALLPCVLDNAMRLRTVKHQLWALHIRTPETALVTMTRSTTINGLIHLLALAKGLSAVMTLAHVQLGYLIAVVLDRTALFLVVLCVLGGLTTDLPVMLGHSTFCDVTLGRAQGHADKGQNGQHCY